MSFTSEARRDLYLVATARAVSSGGDYLAATALALTLQTRGDHGYGVAGLLIAEALPLVLFGSLGGRLADRVDSRTLLVTTGLVQAAICAVLAYVGSPVAMIALVALLSAGVAITQPTLTALIPQIVGRANLPRAMAIGQTASAVGMLAGPAVGGLLVGVYGPHVPLLVDAATYLAIAAGGLALSTRRGGKATRGPAAADGAPAPTPAGAAPGRWRLRQDRLLMTMVVSLACVIAAVTAVSVVELFFVRETLGASTTMYGLVTAVWTLGTLAGAWPFGRIGAGADRRLVLIQLASLTGLSAVVLVSAGVPTAIWLLPLYLLGGALNAGLNVLAGVVFGRRVPAAVRGRVGGLVGAVASSASLIGYLAGGLLMPHFPPRVLLAGTGLVAITVALAFLVPLLAAGRTPVEPDVVGADEAPVAVG